MVSALLGPTRQTTPETPARRSPEARRVRVINGVVHKCIHEGLDLGWCDCTEDIRQECNVQLPTPDEWDELHGDENDEFADALMQHAGSLAAQPWWDFFVARQESLRKEEGHGGVE